MEAQGKSLRSRHEVFLFFNDLCVCLCLFSFTLKASPDWTKQLKYCQSSSHQWNAEEITCIKYLFFRIKDRHRKNLRTSNCVRVSMKLGKATWSKKQHLEKARSVGTFFFTNHGNRQHKGRYCLKRYYTERGYFLLEKAFLIFSNQHWLRSWHRWKDPFNLTVKTATISWALFVDTICGNLSLQPPSPRQSRFHIRAMICNSNHM